MPEKSTAFCFDSFFGLPGGNRTPDPQLRRLLLYPTELRAASGFRRVSGAVKCSGRRRSDCPARLETWPQASAFAV
ncbi:hypothetical protein THIARS_90261 [Thiomonas delicata]|uniref:Uncharacterized protein n=1 Tax=Thiomonas delicata TaxID=364030 RepID=A0A238DA63_THIDL|nr:hypothetical protein THIARS_90261 [Thiomonas delicata]